MVVRIRLSMHGLRNNKFFRLVAINSRQRRDARPIETLGEYRPRVTPRTDPPIKTVEWSVDRIKYWLGVGAIPSKSATRLLTQVCMHIHSPIFVSDRTRIVGGNTTTYVKRSPSATSSTHATGRKVACSEFIADAIMIVRLCSGPATPLLRVCHRYLLADILSSTI